MSPMQSGIYIGCYIRESYKLGSSRILSLTRISSESDPFDPDDLTQYHQNYSYIVWHALILGTLLSI